MLLKCIIKKLNNSDTIYRINAYMLKCYNHLIQLLQSELMRLSAMLCLEANKFTINVYISNLESYMTSGVARRAGRYMYTFSITTAILC